MKIIKSIIIVAFVFLLINESLYSKSKVNKSESDTLIVTGNSVVFLRPVEDKNTKLSEEEKSSFDEADSDFGFAIIDTKKALKKEKALKNIKTHISQARYICFKNIKKADRVIDRLNTPYGIIMFSPDKEVRIENNILGYQFYINLIRTYFSRNEK